MLSETAFTESQMPIVSACFASHTTCSILALRMSLAARGTQLVFDLRLLTDAS